MSGITTPTDMPYPKQLWSDAISPDASLMTSIKPYMYELCLLNVSTYILSLAKFLASLFYTIFDLCNALSSLLKSKKTRRFLRANKKGLLWGSGAAGGVAGL